MWPLAPSVAAFLELCKQLDIHEFSQTSYLDKSTKHSKLTITILKVHTLNLCNLYVIYFEKKKLWEYKELEDAVGLCNVFIINIVRIHSNVLQVSIILHNCIVCTQRSNPNGRLVHKSFIHSSTLTNFVISWWEIC